MGVYYIRHHNKTRIWCIIGNANIGVRCSRYFSFYSKKFVKKWHFIDPAVQWKQTWLNVEIVDKSIGNQQVNHGVAAWWRLVSNVRTGTELEQSRNYSNSN